MRIRNLVLTATPPTPSIAFSSAQPSAANILQNSDNNIIGGIKLDVTTANATLTGVSVTTEMTNIDGEMKGQAPFSFRVHKNKVRVYTN